MRVPLVRATIVLKEQSTTEFLLDWLGTLQSGAADLSFAAAGPGTAARPAQDGNIAALGNIAAALPEVGGTNRGWFRGIGNFLSVDSSRLTPGFSVAAGGFLAGLERPVLPDLHLGIAGGYLHSDLSQAAASGKMDSGRVGLYGRGRLGPNLFIGTIGYGYQRITTDRDIAGIGSAQQTHNGHDFTIAGQWSLPLPLPGIAGTALLTPKAGAQYLHLTEDGFTETGAGDFGLKAAGHDTDSLQPYIGLTLAETFVTEGGAEFTPKVRLSYRHEALSNRRTVSVLAADGTGFLVNGVKPSPDMLTFGVGATLRAQDNMFFYAN